MHCFKASGGRWTVLRLLKFSYICGAKKKMNMKRHILLVLLLLSGAVAGYAQTAEEILAKMEAVMDEYNESEGVAMKMGMKFPIIGTITTTMFTRGEKSKIMGKMVGKDMTTWSDGETEWSLIEGELTISNVKKNESDNDADLGMFEGIVDGYDVSIRKQDANAWYIRCKKNKANTDKDAPKNMDIVVQKETYYPLSLSASMSMVTVTITEITYGVSEEEVTFHPENYTIVKTIDKR